MDLRVTCDKMRKILFSKINQIVLFTIHKFLANQLECPYLLTLPFLWIYSLDPSPADKSACWWLRISSEYSLTPLPLWSRPSLFPTDSNTDPSMPSGFNSPRLCLALWFGKWREACTAACAFTTPQNRWSSCAAAFVEECFEKLFSLPHLHIPEKELPS